MPTVNSQGDLTATGAEDTVWDVTTNKWFTGKLSLALMQAGDIVTIRMYFKLRSSGVSTLDLEWSETYTDAQTGKKIIKFAPEPSDIEYMLTLQQTAGTNRVFPWKLYEA